MITRIRNRIIVVSLILVLALGIPVGANELNDAIHRQQQIEKEQSRAQGQLRSLTNQADALEKQIQQLTSEIAWAEQDLAKKEAAYAKAQDDVKKVQKEVEDKEEELESRQEALRKRVKTIYEEGELSYLEVLFQSTDISDFISRMEYMSYLVENDQTLLADIRVQKKQLDEKKKELTARMDEAKQLKEQAVAANSYLNNKKAQKEVALVENEKYQEQLLVQIEKLEKDSKALEEKIRQLQAQNTGINGHIGIWPTPGYWYITSPFGYRVHPITRQYKLHTGVDIGAPYGAKIAAAGAGIVIFSGWYGAYGNAVIIDHGNGLSTLHGHMSSRAVKYGQSVVPGQTIGYVGSTGWSTGAHLHFEVRKNGSPINPMQFYK